KNEPAWALLPPGTPSAVRTLISRCLRKDPNERLHDIADARIEISDAPNDPDMGHRTRGILSVERWLWGGAAVILLGLVALTGARALRPADSPAEVRLEMTTPSTGDLTSIAISPDRRFIVSVASVDGLPKLWLRALDGTVSRALAGTDGAIYPFWSPDSRSI